MGFFEDDRVRSKNVVYSTAQQIYNNLKTTALNEKDLKTKTEQLLGDYLNLHKDEVIAEVLRLAKIDNILY